ncbi:MAG: head GIN domain-containing protein [Actinomycetota bacterium]
MRKKGSGTVASAPIEVTPFRAIEASHHFTVRVAIGSPESATLRIDDNLLDAVDVGVRDGTLRVGLRPLTEVTHATLEVDVTAPALDRVMASGASRVRIEGRNEAERVDLTLSGSSELTADLDVGRGHLELSGTSTATLSGAAGTLEVTVSGASHLYADELSVGDLRIDVSGAATADVAVSGRLSAGASGASMVRYAGSPDIERSTTSGASSIGPM